MLQTWCTQTAGSDTTAATDRVPPQKRHVPPQSSSQPLKQQSRKDPRQQQFHSEPGPQVKQDAPRQQPAHERQESRPNQEPQHTPRQKQRVRIQEDSPTVDDGRGKRPRVVETGPQKMETDQVPESELPPVPEDDDLNATVLEVMTDVEVLLDGSSVIDVFAVNSARRKRVEVSERKLTESDRKLFRKAKELELQSWPDQHVFDLVKKKFVDQERVMRARWVLTWKSTGKAKARLCVLGFQDPDLTEVPRDSPTLSAASEALIMQWVASHKYRLISGDIKTAFLRDSVAVEKCCVRTGKCAKEMVGQTQDIAYQTWIHKLCSRSMCICSSKEWKNPWSARCAC